MGQLNALGWLAHWVWKMFEWCYLLLTCSAYCNQSDGKIDQSKLAGGFAIYHLSTNMCWKICSNFGYQTLNSSPLDILSLIVH